MVLTFSALSLLIAIWLFPRAWFLVVQNKVELDLKFHPRYVTVGEVVEIQCVLRNKSWLPCPFVEILIQLPEGLSVSRSNTKRAIRFGTYLERHQEMEVTMACYAVKRGLQRLHNFPVYVQLNEGLGLHLLVMSKSQNAILVVMPPVLGDDLRMPELKAVSGRIERFHWLQPDESLLRGIREYQLGDPLKHIAWQASASQGKWMVKQFSASTEATVCLILNAQMFADYWSGARHEEFDRLCEMVAGYARELESRGFQLKFATNGVLLRNPSRVYFGVQTAMAVRAMLGEVEPYATRDFMRLWEEYATAAPTEETAVVFTSYEGPEWHSTLVRERRAGRNVEVVYGPDPILSRTSKEQTGEGRISV